jgi:hypothetical protein
VLQQTWRMGLHIVIGDHWFGDPLVLAFTAGWEMLAAQGLNARQ